MLDPTSRYANLETVTITLPDGRVATYKRRRFLPSGQDMRLLAELTVTEGDRLDLLTARTLGDPEQFWRVCDSNDVLNPFEVMEEPGALVRIAMPEI
ncbi:LysM domain-containing protein [Pyxidicoccus parkwayensis]|uniref:LysM domain-containing protein n=1 Tax=Pyxidicoccus parkwayensis TaxID=2813578 RepID=A0ABX7PAW4_9BACT|nr:LysM domain-containing protein [Pyxidicoccus parkwaysis]QSQ27588.1 LysM domain-containing protein [Pyxidicoccus parkwaysis]